MTQNSTTNDPSTADMLERLSKQRQSLQISDWEYQTAKQRLIAPNAQTDSVLARNCMALLIVAGIVGAGLVWFSTTYPKQAEITAGFATEIFTIRRQKVIFEHHQQFVEDTDIMVDGWFNAE